MEYEVVIKILDSVEYRGCMNSEVTGLTIESTIDNDQYEEMFIQLFSQGYIDVQGVNEDYDVNVKSFDRNLEAIFKYLIKEGLTLEYKEKDDNEYSEEV